MSDGPQDVKDPTLSEVLSALRDPIRRRILLRLREGERQCSGFSDLGSKTALSYHFAILRAAGLTRAKRDGTCLLLSLRTQGIERLFPGLLGAVLEGALRETRLPEVPG